MWKSLKIPKNNHSKTWYFQNFQITDLPIGKSVMGSITDRLPISVIMETLFSTPRREKVHLKRNEFKMKTNGSKRKLMLKKSTY